MSTFDVRVEEQGLGVKLAPEPLSSKVSCLRVVGINNQEKADRVMLQEGDLLYALNGNTFADPKEFLVWARLPPYMLTVVRKVEGEILSEEILTGRASSSSSSAAAKADAGAKPGILGVQELLGRAIQLKLPKGWQLGKATGIGYNCLLDSLLQLLKPQLEAAEREEQARTCREALVEQGLCSQQQFLTTVHIAPALQLLGSAPEHTTVCILGFAELEKRITPERVGCGTKQLLVLANVSRHAHLAPVSVTSDYQRIDEGLQVIGALRDSVEREQALDDLLGKFLGYSGGA